VVDVKFDLNIHVFGQILSKFVVLGQKNHPLKKSGVKLDQIRPNRTIQI